MSDIECGGIAPKVCGHKPKKFFYAWKDYVDENGDNCVLVYLVDELGLEIERGKILTLPKSSSEQVRFACGINQDIGLDLDFQGDGTLVYDEAGNDDNSI
jgi:hypothetical protein